MILSCGACGAQNFVSRERLAVAASPPRCWKCGALLPVEGETGSRGPESKRGSRERDRSGEVGDG